MYQAQGALLTPSRATMRTVVGLNGVSGSERESNHDAGRQRKTGGLLEEQGTKMGGVCHYVRQIRKNGSKCCVKQVLVSGLVWSGGKMQLLQLPHTIPIYPRLCRHLLIPPTLPTIFPFTQLLNLFISIAYHYQVFVPTVKSRK